MIFVGIDPGKSGGIAWLYDAADYETSHPVTAYKTDGRTDADLWELFREFQDSAASERACAVIEQVASSPQMGVVSAFSFGRNFGFWIGCLAASGIPYALVRPQKWQKAMGCLSKGDKNRTKAAAQRLYPQEKVTHATADALLIATFCRRHHSELF